MHEQRIRLGARHQTVVDLIALEQVVPARAVAVAHRHPGVGDHAVGALRGLLRIGAELDRGTRALDPVEQPFLRGQLRRGRDLQAEIEPLGGVHPGGEHVVGVAGPGHGLAADRAAVLLEGHHVGEHLARMGAPGEAVDDRHRRMAGEPDQHLVIEGADHDAVDVARQHPGGVGDGLAAPELHLLTGQGDRFTAELAHGDVERHARARRRLVEDHRQGAAGERLVGGHVLAPRLHGAARLDHPAQLLAKGCR